MLISTVFMGTGCTTGKSKELNVYTALEEEHLEPYLTTFRIGNIGNITENDIKRLLDTIKVIKFW
jgi:aspartate aminotransferase-like enzyme